MPSIKVDQMSASHEQNLSAIEKTKIEIERNQTEMAAAVTKVNEEKENLAIKFREKEKVERDANNAEAEVKLLRKEKTRLEELVVTDPDQWERAFQARLQDIKLGKAEISDLKNKQIPKRENDVRKAQQFEKDIMAVTDQMTELKTTHDEHTKILSDLSNVQGDINQLNKNLVGLKRDRDFKMKSNQLQIAKMETQEGTLFDDKDRQASQNAEYFDIKKGLTREFKQIQKEHVELMHQMKNYQTETPKMQAAHDQHTDELKELNDKCISLHRQLQDDLLQTLPE